MRIKNSTTQSLIGLSSFTEHGIATMRGELVFFQVAPTNISVLSAANIDLKIRHLQQVLSSQPNIELCCLDSVECFDDNKEYIKSRIEQEPNDAVKVVLEQDLDFLDNIQLEMSTARQFMLVLRVSDRNGDRLTQINRAEKIIAEQGFEVKKLGKADLKRLLAVYFGVSMGGELLGDYDGQQHLNRKNKPLTEQEQKALELKSFLDIVLPSTVKFYTDHYVCGDKYCCVWAVREYPPSTEEQAIFAQLADRNGVTLRLYSRPVDSLEQRKIIQNATRKNKLKTGGNDVQDTITAEGNLQDVVELIANLRRNKEPLLHTAVFMELRADSKDNLTELQQEILMELTRSKITVDRLTLRQKEGFLSSLPVGSNQFGAQYERVLPASSVANLYPLSYSGKTDPQGLYIGRDKYGTNILVDFDRRSDDKTNANALILGNSGQGKSYLMKLILTNLRESGKSIITLDAEAEYEELTQKLGGCYIDFMSGEYIINPLEPKSFGQESEPDDQAPQAFRKLTRLSQHIAYLKDFFRAYKDFTDAQVDAIEIMLSKLYAKHGITDTTDYSKLSPTDYPTVKDFYELIEEEFMEYDHESKHLYTEEMLQEIALGLHSMCVGSESKYFCGHTNISPCGAAVHVEGSENKEYSSADMNSAKFICFGVKGLMDTNKRLKDTMLFNILSYMTGRLLGEGNTVASIDELYLFLTNLTAIEYIRNAMKRVRKKDSAVIVASQNVDDFLIDGVKEYTKPLFSIPTHQFLFNAGNVEPKAYTDTLQLEQSEFELIKYPARGVCLYRCGNERYLLQVIAPDYKAVMFGQGGGR